MNAPKTNIVFVISDKRTTKRVISRVKHSFFLRGASGEGLIAETLISRIGDLATTKGVKEVYEDIIPTKVLRGMSPEARRLATVWNWRLQSKRRSQPVTDAQVSKLMKKLGLEIRNNMVMDKYARKKLGRVQEGKLDAFRRIYSPNPHCWWLRGTYSWRIVPGWFGAWTRVRGTSETRRCTASGGMSSTRQIVDYIRVSAWNQVGAYVWRSRRNSSFVDGTDWEYVWFWEYQSGGARTSSDHYARWGNSIINLSF